ncbi:jg21600 [Pararge aegeria aegeria]|uniref:Jg21600 protein n=1 Tax=Pararge aegeria aegeria TaxID=348720 RepID=A0A8S4QSF5_9NEOP|nr:jg21600 [Pararge aegeria aegeria]
MKLLTCLTAFALLSLLAAAPISNEGDENKELYIEDFVKYKAEHDIVYLVVLINSIYFDKDHSSEFESKEADKDILVNFLEAEVQPDGSHVDQDLYNIKEGAKKILENGSDAVASVNQRKIVFFGAKDGLYVYNPATNEAYKYRQITDSVIAITMAVGGDIIYVLTEDRQHQMAIYSLKFKNTGLLSN